MKTKIDAFHAHLDVCDQCRNNPFALCAAGERLLIAAGEDAEPCFRRSRKSRISTERSQR